MKKNIDHTSDTKQIIKDGIEKHGMLLNIEDQNIHALVRYVLNIGFNNGYMAYKKDLTDCGVFPKKS